MNSFLRGSGHLGTSALHIHSGQFSANASLTQSSSVLLQSGSASPLAAPSPVNQAVGGLLSSDDGVAADSPSTACVEPLTMAGLKRFVRQLRQQEGRTPISAVAPAPSGGGGTRWQRLGATIVEPPSTTEHTSAQEPDDDRDSEEMDVYTSRTERQVRTFLADLHSEGGMYAPEPIPEPAVEQTSAEERKYQRERLRELTTEELRAAVLELHTELTATLYDAVTLETNLTETDEDAAVLERAVGAREEKLEMLKVQLSTVEDYNEELHDAKKEALRKLSEARTEMALLSQRNAKLLRQLDMKEKELQMSFTTSLNDSQRPSTTPVRERQDASTLTEVVTATNRASEALPPALVGESVLGVSGRSKSTDAHQREMEEMQEELRLARTTLYAAETERIQLQEQLQELREATMHSQHISRESAQAASHESESAELLATRERCIRSEEHAVALESELRQLRTELHAAQNRLEEQERATAAAAAAASLTTEVRDDLRVAPSSGAATPIDSSTSPVRPSESRTSSAEALAAADVFTNARRSISQPRSVSMEAQMIVLQRQLGRAQGEVARLEQDLLKEREKSKRQGLAEKKLLENVTYLTRQLRAREALEREARSMRRSEVNTARGDDEGGEEGGGSAPTSEPRRATHYLRSSTAYQSSRGVNALATTPHGTTTFTTAGTATAAQEDGAAAVTTSGSGGGDDGGSRRREQQQQQHRHGTPELRRRRESVFAALRDAHRLSEERRVSAVDTSNLSLTSSAPDRAGATPTPPGEREGTQQQLIASSEDPKVVLARRSSGASDTPAATATATALAAVSHASSTTGPTAASGEHPSTSVASFRVRRLSAASLVSPRGPRSGSFDATRRESIADSVRLDLTTPTTPTSNSSVTAAATKVAAVSAPATQGSPLRQAFRRAPVSTLGGDHASVGRRTAEGSAEHQPLQPTAAAPNAMAATARPTAESKSFILPEALALAQEPHTHHYVSRGLSCVRAANSARPAGARSSSVGASTHRNSLSLAVPTVAVASTPAAVSSNSSNNNCTSTTAATRGAAISRGLATTVGGGGSGGGPVVPPRKRTASHRIATGRDARLSSPREGSTTVTW